MKARRGAGVEAPAMYRHPGARSKRDRDRDADKVRGTSTDRGYDATWSRLRRMHLNEHPYCARCWSKGRTVEADMVDHVVPISVDPSRRLDPDNLQSLCWPCHNRDKQREDAALYGATRRERYTEG